MDAVVEVVSWVVSDVLRRMLAAGIKIHHGKQRPNQNRDNSSTTRQPIVPHTTLYLGIPKYHSCFHSIWKVCLQQIEKQNLTAAFSCRVA